MKVELSVVPLVIAGLLLVIYISHSQQLFQAYAAWSQSIAPESLAVNLAFLIILISLGYYLLKKLGKSLRFDVKIYELVMFPVLVLGLAALLNLSISSSFVCIAISLALVTASIILSSKAKTWLWNLLVILQSLALVGVFLPFTTSIPIYATFLVLLATWDFLAVEKLGIMQKLATKLLEEKYPVCYVLQIYQNSRSCLGNGDLAIIFLYPILLYRLWNSWILSFLGFILQLILVLGFIYIVQTKIKEPQPFVPYLAFAQSILLLLLNFLV